MCSGYVCIGDFTVRFHYFVGPLCLFVRAHAHFLPPIGEVEEYRKCDDNVQHTPASYPPCYATQGQKTTSEEKHDDHTRVYPLAGTHQLHTWRYMLQSHVMQKFEFKNIRNGRNKFNEK